MTSTAEPRFRRDIIDQPAALASVLDALLGQDAQALARGAALLRDARHVVFSSMGSGHLSAWPAYARLAEGHPGAQITEAADLLRRPVAKDAVFVLVSRSGESGEVAALAPYLRAGGARVLAITMTPDSTMARNADLVLPVAATYDGFICTKAYTGLMLAALLLAEQTLNPVAPRLIESLKDAIGRMPAWIDSLFHDQRLQPFVDASIVHFLSHGAGLGTAQMGALLFAEGARTPACAHTIGAFHHGSVELVDQRFVGLWIDLDPHERSRILHAEVAQHAGVLLNLVPTGAEATAADLQLPGDLPAFYRPLLAAPVVQIATYRAGSARGHEPGAMRYLGWVVK